MAFSLDTVFTTITATPSIYSGISEISPVDFLKPYIRCFWTSSCDSKSTRIIPDCCADIIIDIDTDHASFVGLSSDNFTASSTGNCFGIRFYAWTVSQFIRADMSKMLNVVISPQSLLVDFDDFQNRIRNADNTAHRINIAQRYLTYLLRDRQDADVMNCLYYIVKNNGNVSVSELACYAIASTRSLERKFKCNIGASPKTIADLIRFQLLWQDSLKNEFDIFDFVEKFGFYDQAHLYNSFKKYHGMGLNEAKSEYRNLSHFYNTKLN